MSESIKAFDKTTADPLAITGTQRGLKRALDVYPNALGPVETAAAANLKSQYDEVTNVVAGVTTTVLTHTFSPTINTSIKSVSVSGDNVATYELFIDSVLIEKQRTYFGGSLNAMLDFYQGQSVGLGSVLEIKAHHQRPMVGSFNATLKYTEAP